MCLARTLITGPDVLLLDQPTASLDHEATKVIEQAVRQLVDSGMTALWVSHDAAQVQRIADRVIHIDNGRSLGMGSVPADPDTGQPSR